MNIFNIPAAILYLTFFVFFSASNQESIGSNYCQFEATTSKGIISTQKCDLDVTNRTDVTVTSSVKISNTVTTWSVMNESPDKLMLSASFAARGEGSLRLTLISEPRYVDPFVCRKIRLQRPEDKNSTAVVNVWLKCSQQQLKSDDKMSLFIDPDARNNRRDTPIKINVDLPGCTLPEFENTELCKKKQEQKIRFHVRRVPDRASVRVVLSPAVYKSNYDSKRRARGRRYYVSIKEESAADDWSEPGEGGKTLQYTRLAWPKRKVRFRLLRLKQTYDVVVWRLGEVKRYVKKITLC